MSNILIVEDELVLAEAYEMILQSAGHTIRRASDGNIALEITQVFEPDLILLDLLMPNLDGLGFLREYDAPKKHPKVKIIIFSNLDMEKESQEAFKLGAHKYMLKAWASPKTLEQVVKDILEEK